MRPLVIAIVAALGCSTSFLPGRAQDSGRTVLARGLFSYEAPPGWSVSDLNLAYPVSEAPVRDGFSPNIRVDIVQSALPLAQFVAANLRAARSTPDFRLISQGPFTTAAGLDGTRVVVTGKVDKLSLRQTFYFFDGGASQKIVVSACCLAKDGTADEAVFDAALKSFSLE